jgi:hypothetical protein
MIAEIAERQHGVVARWQLLGLGLGRGAYHQTTAAFERDRTRDRRAQAHGWRPIRVTDRALRQEPDALVVDVRALLYVSAAPARSA